MAHGRIVKQLALALGFLIVLIAEVSLYGRNSTLKAQDVTCVGVCVFRSAREQFKVVGAIIRLDSVLVVNHLFGEQFASNHSFHNKPMFEVLLASVTDSNVTTSCKLATVLLGFVDAQAGGFLSVPRNTLTPDNSSYVCGSIRNYDGDLLAPESGLIEVYNLRTQPFGFSKTNSAGVLVGAGVSKFFNNIENRLFMDTEPFGNFGSRKTKVIQLIYAGVVESYGSRHTEG